jgi:hypothetical protein
VPRRLPRGSERGAGQRGHALRDGISDGGDVTEPVEQRVVAAGLEVRAEWFKSWHNQKRQRLRG